MAADAWVGVVQGAVELRLSELAQAVKNAQRLHPRCRIGVDEEAVEVWERLGVVHRVPQDCLVREVADRAVFGC